MATIRRAPGPGKVSIHVVSNYSKPVRPYECIDVIDSWCYSAAGDPKYIPGGDSISSDTTALKAELAAEKLSREESRRNAEWERQQAERERQQAERRAAEERRLMERELEEQRR